MSEYCKYGVFFVRWVLMIYIQRSKYLIYLLGASHYQSQSQSRELQAEG